MRVKGAPIDVEAERFARDLDVVVQQLQPRILFHPHPYDSRPPKVRERADAAEVHGQLAVAARDLGRRGAHRIGACSGG